MLKNVANTVMVFRCESLVEIIWVGLTKSGDAHTLAQTFSPQNKNQAAIVQNFADLKTKFGAHLSKIVYE